MQGQDTVREDQNATLREETNANATIRESQDATLREETNANANATVREGQGAANPERAGAGAFFHTYRIVRQLPTRGSEADIFILEKEGRQYALKQYRYGIEPKREILLAIKALGESHPHEFIRIFEADFDAAGKRWYEIQEYVEHGSLQAVMADRSLLTGAQRATFFNDVAREIADALNILHQNNLLHLDLKPSNILLRSVSPLDLVLIDFGIAASLDSDMSKKFTQARGTPMYQSPESYSGGMGKPADWWGLGMILLEIATGTHPFKGLNNNVIAYSISTEPVPIPENLDAGRKELLRGLLTRDPEKRWGYEQVARWLSGERNIPQYFEAAPATPQPAEDSLTPITFMGALYRNLPDLAVAFLKNELAWEKGKAFLLRGYVKQWLEKNDEFETAVDTDNVLSGAEDADEKLFRFTQRFGRETPFAFGGHLITLENLLIFAGKALKRQPVTAMEQKIVDSLANGLLLSCLEFYKQQGRTSESLQNLEIVLKTVKGKSREQIAKRLDIFTHPEKYASLLNGSGEGLSSAGLGRLGSLLQRIGLRRNEQTRTENTPQGDMSIQEIAKRISALEEQEKKEHQKRLEQEKREQEKKEQQERLEQEKREQERRKQQEKLERERREQQDRIEQERREQERRRQQERIERQRKPQNRIDRKTFIRAFITYPILFYTNFLIGQVFILSYTRSESALMAVGIISMIVPIIMIRRFASLSIAILVSVIWFIIMMFFH
ncbi:MAG: protein kinase [bacterium]|nr:protein kinase [bacterium]